MDQLLKDGEIKCKDKIEYYNLPQFYKENLVLCLKANLCCTSTRKIKILQWVNFKINTTNFRANMTLW